MIIKLIKQNKKTTDVVFLEIDFNLIRKKEGKLGKTISFSSTINCGSIDNAKLEFEKLIKEYKSKGFISSNSGNEIIESEVFDKAKWHLEGNFPIKLNSHHAYNHTGFYIGWLILNNLISNEFKAESKQYIREFLDKKMTAVDLYEHQLDGVFTSNEVNELGFRFTKNYFDFEKGRYLEDYEETLAAKLPTLFDVQDTWENFEKICKVLDKRYQEFKDNSL